MGGWGADTGRALWREEELKGKGHRCPLWTSLVSSTPADTLMRDPKRAEPSPGPSQL